MTRKPVNKLYANLKPTAKMTIEITGRGPRGKDGHDGKSAYEVWLSLGNEGTEEDFINSLKASEIDYNSIINKPTINNVVIEGDISLEDLGIEAITTEEIEKLFE